MAFSTRSSLFFFFTTLVLLSTQINARDSYFFGKLHRESTKDQNPNNVLPLKKEQDHDPTFIPESENSYGLYGHENNNDKVNGETFSTPSLNETEESFNNYDEKYPKKTERYGSNGYKNEEFYDNNKYEEEFNNKKYDENVKDESFSDNKRSFYNSNAYGTNKYYGSNVNDETNKYGDNFKEEFNNKYDENVKEESLSNEEKKRSFYNSNAYGTELERETPYKGSSHNLERQGMSDTRFMEKGNYYYDLYNGKNHGQYYRKPHKKSPAGYYSSPVTETTYDQQSYGNDNNNEENEFKDPYNSKWEKNQPEEFVDEQVKP